MSVLLYTYTYHDFRTSHAYYYTCSHYLNFIDCEHVNPQPSLICFHLLINAVISNESHDVLRPIGAASRVADNEHVVRFGDKAPPQLLETFCWCAWEQAPFFNR